MRRYNHGPSRKHGAYVKITAAIAHTGDNIVQAAKLLGTSERALWAKRKKYELK